MTLSALGITAPAKPAINIEIPMTIAIPKEDAQK